MKIEELHRREAEADNQRKLERDRFSRGIRRARIGVWVSTIVLLAAWLWSLASRGAN